MRCSSSCRASGSSTPRPRRCTRHCWTRHLPGLGAHDVPATAYAVAPERFVRRPPRPPALPTGAWINKPDRQQAAHSYEDVVVKGVKSLRLSLVLALAARSWSQPAVAPAAPSSAASTTQSSCARRGSRSLAGATRERCSSIPYKAPPTGRVPASSTTPRPSSGRPPVASASKCWPQKRKPGGSNAQLWRCAGPSSCQSTSSSPIVDRGSSTRSPDSSTGSSPAASCTELSQETPRTETAAKSASEALLLANGYVTSVNYAGPST